MKIFKHDWIIQKYGEFKWGENQMINKITIFWGEISRQVAIKQTHYFPETFIRIR